MKTPQTNASSHFIACLITVFAFGIFTYNSGRHSFWLDEAVTISNVTEWSAMWEFIASAESGKFWLHHLPVFFLYRFNDSEFWMRLYSVFFATATVSLTCLLGKIISGRNAGMAAGLIVAINHNMLAHAQEVRMYAMLVFFFALATYLYIRAMRFGTKLTWIAYAIAALLGIFTHLFMTLALLSHAVSALAYRRFSDRLPALLITYGGITIGFLLSLGVSGLNGIVSTAAGTTWIPIPVPRNVLGYAHFVSGQTLPWWFHVLLISAALVLCISAIIKYSPLGGARASIVLSLTLPVAITYLFSTQYTPVFLNRYLVTGIVPFSLLVALVLIQVQNPIFIALTITIYLINPGQKLIEAYTQPRENWRAIASHVSSNIRAKDGFTAIPNYARVPYQLYANRTEFRPDFISADEILVISPTTVLPPRMWVIKTGYPPDSDQNAVIKVLNAKYPRSDETIIDGVVIMLFQ